MKVKKVFAIVLFIFLNVNLFAQNYSNYLFPSNDGEFCLLENRGSRKIVGGTVFRTKFVGSGFTKQRQGAFEYACKLWEEKLPTTLPINITVNFDKNTNPPYLAKIGSLYDNEGEKERIFAKREIISYESFDSEIASKYTLDFLRDANDINITFASPGLFDFSLDENNINHEKYDFVTVALQAIGKALGFCLNANKTDVAISLQTPCNNFTKGLLTGDEIWNYSFATSGNARMRFHSPDGYLLYSPRDYDPKYSLSYFDIDRNNKETLLMQPRVLSKGSVIRYIGDDPWAEFFSFCGWDKPIAVGVGYGENIVESASTDNVIPYKEPNKVMTYEVKAEKVSDSETETAESYVKKLREFQEDGTYVMLCDGTWQKCSYNLSDLNSQDGNYARTVDGYLRIKRCVTVNHGIGWPSSFNTRYLLADFPPQKPDASVIGCVNHLPMLLLFIEHRLLGIQRIMM